MSHTLFSALWIFFIPFLIQVSDCREVSRVINGFNSNASLSDNNIEIEPILSKNRLSEIRLYDRMRCFPLLLCTLTKSDAFKKLGSIDLNELADGYIRLLSAFPGGPPLDVNAKDDEDMTKFKNDMEEFIKTRVVDPKLSKQVSKNKNKDDDDDDDSDEEIYKRDEIKESEEMLLTDPLLHQKEKLEMKNLMEQLVKEEAEEAEAKKTWTETAMSLPMKIPMKIGTSLFNSVVLPYIVGDLEKLRTKRDLHRKFPRVETPATNESAITKAMKLWVKLKDAEQCGVVYPTCPFEAWEVVSMIKLVAMNATNSTK